MAMWNNFKQKMEALINSYTSEFKQVNTIKVFRGSILVFIFLYVLQFLPIAKQYFGPDNYMIPYYKSSNLLLKPLNLLEGTAYSVYYLYFLVGILLSILSYFLLPFKRLSLIVTYIYTYINKKSCIRLHLQCLSSQRMIFYQCFAYSAIFIHDISRIKFLTHLLNTCTLVVGIQNER